MKEQKGMILPLVLIFILIMTAAATMYLSASTLQYHVSLNQYRLAKNLQTARLALQAIKTQPICQIAAESNQWITKQSSSWWQEHACHMMDVYYIAMPISETPCVNFAEVIVHVEEYSAVNLGAIFAFPNSTTPAACPKQRLLQASWVIE